MIMSGLALLLALVLLGTASLAWFTISTNPEITGIKVNIFTDKAILVSDDGTNFDESTVISFDRYVPLTPVSTVDGQNWFLPAYNDDGSLKDSTEFILDDNLTHANVLRYAPLEPDSETGVVPEYDITKKYPELEGAELMEAYKKGYYLYTDIYLKTELEEGATVRLSNPTPTPSLEKEDYPDLTDEEFQEFKKLQEQKETSDWAKKKGVDGSYVVPRYTLHADPETGTTSVVNISQQAESSVRVGFLVNPSHVGSSRADYMHTQYLNEEPSEDGLGLGENPQDVYWATEKRKVDTTPRTRTVLTEESKETVRISEVPTAADAVQIVNAFLAYPGEALPEGTPSTWKLIGTVPCTAETVTDSGASLTVKNQDREDVTFSGKTERFYTLDQVKSSLINRTAEWTVTEHIQFTSDDTLEPFVPDGEDKIGTVSAVTAEKTRTFSIVFTWTEGTDPVTSVKELDFPVFEESPDYRYQVNSVYTYDETGTTDYGKEKILGVWTSKANLDTGTETKTVVQETKPEEVVHTEDTESLPGVLVETYSAETKKTASRYYSGDMYKSQENRFVIYEPNADKRSLGPDSLKEDDAGPKGKPDKEIANQSDRYIISYYIQDTEYQEGNYIVTRPIGIDGTRTQTGTDEEGKTISRQVPNFVPISLERKVIGSGTAAETYLDRLIVQRKSTWDEEALLNRLASGSLTAADPLFYFKNALRFVTDPENADDPNYGLSSCISAMGRFLRAKTVYEKLENRALNENYQKELFAVPQQDNGNALYTTVSGTDQDASFNASPDVNVSDTIVVKLQQDVPVKIRLFIWIEGQDVDCWNDIASGSFHMNLEFAATDGGQVQTEENEGK